MNVKVLVIGCIVFVVGFSFGVLAGWEQWAQHSNTVFENGKEWQVYPVDGSVRFTASDNGTVVIEIRGMKK